MTEERSDGERTSGDEEAEEAECGDEEGWGEEEETGGRLGVDCSVVVMSAEGR